MTKKRSTARWLTAKPKVLGYSVLVSVRFTNKAAAKRYARAVGGEVRMLISAHELASRRLPKAGRGR